MKILDNYFKDRVLEAVDIVDVVGERVRLTRKGKDYIGLCPFHPDHKPSLSVSPGKRIFKCWSCAAGGDVIRFVQLIDRCSFGDALETLARRAGLDLRSSPADRRAQELREQLLAAVAWARQHFQRNLGSSVGQAAREYAAKRGLSDDTVARFGLGYAVESWDDLCQAARRANLAPELLEQAGLVARHESGRHYDRFRNRLIFPITDALGRPIAFGGRTLGDDPAKYLNSPETALFSKSRVLYGLDLARKAIEQQRAALVVEGYLDAVLLSQHGFQNVLATLGTALTEAHAKLLRPLADTLFLCFDSDTAGVKAANRAVEVALRTQIQVRVVVLEGDKDPADCLVAGGPARFAEHLKHAREALEFKWSQAVSAFGAGAPQSRRQTIEEFLQFVAGVTDAGGIDPLQQDLLVGRLSGLLGVPAEEVFELLARQRRMQRRASGPAPATSDGGSAYESGVRGLPPGLITTVETLLGLLARDQACWESVDDIVVDAIRHSQTWERLYALLLDVHDELGQYSLGDVVARTDEAAMCELVDRAVARSAGAGAALGLFCAAHERLKSELELMRMDALRERQRACGGDDADVFQRMCDSARARDGVLPPERQVNARPLTPRR